MVKRIREDQSDSTTFVEMFCRTRPASSALLNHQNIVQIYDFGQVEGCYFLTMEYLRGQDSARGSCVACTLSGGGSITGALAAFVAQQVAQGLWTTRTV